MDYRIGFFSKRGDMADGIGLSIGSTNLTAVVVGRTALTRSPVLTLFPHRPAEVGVPSENPNLNERGLILTDFVERVGDPVGMLAPDGSSHRGETVLADALAALLRTLTGGRPPVDPIAVTHPAHWRPNQVEALRAELAAVGGFGDPVLVPDAKATLVALQDNPGVPTRGVIAVCDFGGSGTSITLADADNGYQPIAPTMRHPDLSGDLMDQGLLTHVVNDLSAAGTIDLASTSAIGSLGRLRAECRRAKERLSTESVTALVAELPGHRSDVRLNRNELDDVIAEPLREFVSVLHGAVERAGLRPGELVAVATTGGGARIPAITTSLSEHLRVPVITAPQPELTPAIGGGLIAVRGTTDDGMTAMAPASAGPPPTAAAALVAPEPPAAPQALAWSDAQNVPDVAPVDDYSPEGYGDDYGTDFDTGFEPAGGRTTARPQLEFGERELTERDEIAALPWYRRPPVILGAGAAAVLVAVVAVLITITGSDEPTRPASNTKAVPSTTAAPDESAPAAPVDEPATVDAPQTVTHEAPAPHTVTQTVEQPAPAAPPVTENPPPAETPTPTTTTEAPPPTTTEAPATTTQAPWSPAAPYPTIPGLPWVPAPGGGHTGG